MAVAGVTARDIGIEAFNLVGEANVLKKIKGAVNRRRLGSALTVEIGEKIIGLGWFAAFQQQLQDLAPDTGQALAFLSGQCFGLGQKRLNILRATRGVGMRMCVSVYHLGIVERLARIVKGQMDILHVFQITSDPSLRELT